MLQLHQQALLQVAGAYPRGLKLLQPVQYRHHFIQFNLDLQLLCQGLANLLQILHDAAVVVGYIDNGQGDQSIDIRQAGQVELPQQLLPQGIIGGIAAVKAGVRQVVA